jgi:hypothetical protein
MMRASRLKATSLGAQWWALELAYWATMQPGGNWAHQAMNLSWAKGRLLTTVPLAHTA